ncbi:MAG: tRNA (guanine-N(7)-)-methyltransferase [Candidatus Anoxychlamydiales bacterium]|nr:tRNA (guanine-N(7)-)-methyltransferase [Candidatus Anoxychlamydiales bacterium]
MKKSDLIIPFKFEDRRPIIINRLLYVPGNYEEHSNFKEKIYFKNNNRLHVEYCSGNGEWIVQKAKKNPNINFIAIEMDFQRARKIWVKMHNENVDNLFIVLGEAKTFTKYYLKNNSIFQIYINFPDPWPKTKHEKNRLIKKEFILEMKRVLIDKCNIIIVTDDKNYSNEIIKNILDAKLKSLYKEPYFLTNLENYGSSYFKSLWVSKGKDIRFHKFEK